MSRLAWELTFGGLCWIAAGITAAACFYAFTREQRIEEEDREATRRARATADPELLTLGDFAIWETELQPQRPVYDWDMEGL